MQIPLTFMTMLDSRTIICWFLDWRSPWKGYWDRCVSSRKIWRHRSTHRQFLSGGEVATLTHEARDHAVEGRALVVKGLATLPYALLVEVECVKVPSNAGSHVGIELHHDVASRLTVDGHVEDDLRIRGRTGNNTISYWLHACLHSFRHHRTLLLSTTLKHWPKFLGKFAATARTHSEPPPQFHYETRCIQQSLDHFSFSELPTFPQRYLISTEHWVGPRRLGPVFFYSGNEDDIEWFAQNTGVVWEIAPRFGAMVVFPEHQYYGESVPYGSAEEAYKNVTTLSYLTSEQALADFSVLIADLKHNFSTKDCPVILFGGSYGGMLAAWMRLKYPHVAVGALASSAPILQFEDIVPPETFYDLVSNAFKSWNEMASAGQTNNGLELLTKTFNLCQKLNRTKDLYDWVEAAYSYLAMVNYPYPAEFMMTLPEHPIREVRMVSNS
ncbi:Lysosomal Pro-X carboxypeptidase [Glycine soja]|uniref:Lysosomal Pro-X carboxypeptidase n=1 Tax=Glycine soja TaxID=3848 RepID=A0A0B2RW18_GLYSO|nr:Lysosomal Pro-X carboxypeptidase [Glycine soja]